MSGIWIHAPDYQVTTESGHGKECNMWPCCSGRDLVLAKFPFVADCIIVTDIRMTNKADLASQEPVTLTG